MYVIKMSFELDKDIFKLTNNGIYCGKNKS